jgi:hypothetical protein
MARGFLAHRALRFRPIRRLDAIETVHFKLVGDSPLIVHAWSEKAKRQMLDKQMKKATKAKEAKDPQADYEACFYRTPRRRLWLPGDRREGGDGRRLSLRRHEDDRGPRRLPHRLRDAAR